MKRISPEAHDFSRVYRARKKQGYNFYPGQNPPEPFKQWVVHVFVTKNSWSSEDRPIFQRSSAWKYELGMLIASCFSTHTVIGRGSLEQHLVLHWHDEYNQLPLSLCALEIHIIWRMSCLSIINGRILFNAGDLCPISILALLKTMFGKLVYEI